MLSPRVREQVEGLSEGESTADFDVFNEENRELFSYFPLKV